MRRLLMIPAVVLALAGCGGNDQPDQTDAAPTQSSPPPAAASLMPEPEPTEPTHGLGDPQASAIGGEITVRDYEQPVATDAPQPAEAGYPDGYVWGGLDVSVCVPDTPLEDGSDYYVTRAVWKLAYSDGALVDPSHTGYSGFPQPEYPWGDTPVALGQCVSGWLVFPVPADEQPAMVHYTGGSGVLQWQLGEQS